jgi:hypothetical protein
MPKMNWGRIFLCGILTGSVWYLLSLLVFLFALNETAYAAAAEAAHRPKIFPALPFLLFLAMGIWTMWLYASIRPRYVPGPRLQFSLALPCGLSRFWKSPKLW